MKIYENLAKTYNWRHDSPSTKHLRVFEKKMLRKYAHGKILDVGCGTGYHLDFLIKNGLDVVGIDNSEEMIKRSKHKIINAPAEKIPFPSEIFDTILCMFSTMNLLEERALREMNRVLKSNGKLIISVASIWDKKYPTFYEKKNTKIEPHMKFKKVSIDKNNLSFRLFTKQDLVEFFKENRFSLVDFKGIFIHQRPFWGRFEDFSISEKAKLILDNLQLSNDLGAMYLAVFEKVV